MSKEITPSIVRDIKVAAKRLGAALPNEKHTRLLDIAAHAISGAADYQQVVREAKAGLAKDKRFSKERMSYADWAEARATFRRGYWYFVPDKRAVVFEGEFAPYIFFLRQLGSTGALLDAALQIQKKKWPDEFRKDPRLLCPDYQVDHFLGLIDDLCRFYFDDSIQGVFSPGGRVITAVDWERAISEKAAMHPLN
ncbi:hypothetical protein SSPSH_001487 [Salinisphaera shabanensis E1L3A]|uniref:Uncharacterized protein n=1 Tax=Salinisphaera shabanensis E1L3A TaxID=1033802 RepID=U2FTX6_9GAMM|nr:hypothetical protein [Salinisphaera shabanensis]ERJ19419.1 hypothetical protein SSPSH_001487 [Salinisphaera shabanensis E1L3A]